MRQGTTAFREQASIVGSFIDAVRRPSGESLSRNKELPAERVINRKINTRLAEQAGWPRPLFQAS